MKQDRKKEIERLRSMEKALVREEAIAGGWYNRAKHQVHKSKKDYSRKEKHHSSYGVN